MPMDSGSGGSRGYYASNKGGDGGGRIRISAVNIVNDGSISSKGGLGEANQAGDGSGGAIYLTVSSLSGYGTINADGGANQVAGGGGRVSVHYIDMSTLDDTNISALGGQGSNTDGG